MTNEEAILIIQNEYKCVDRDCDIERSCGKCDLMMPSKEPILEAYKLAIKALEQTTWIPVSKVLPKDNGWYQCTVILDEQSLTMDLYYKNGKWLDNRRINMFDCYDIYGYGNTTEKHKLSYQELISEFEWTENVVAWQPLPESYQGE